MTTESEAKALVKEALEEFLISQAGKRYKDIIIEDSPSGALRNYFKVGSIYRQNVAGSDCMVMVYKSDKPIDKNTKRRSCIICLCLATSDTSSEKTTGLIPHD